MQIASQAAIKALRLNQVNSKQVSKCIERLNPLVSHNKISILWIPGHGGSEGNEPADELTRNGAEMLLLGPEPFCRIEYGFMAAMLKNEKEKLRELLLGEPTTNKVV